MRAVTPKLIEEEYNARFHSFGWTVPGHRVSVEVKAIASPRLIDPRVVLKRNRFAIAESFYIETVTRHLLFYFCANTFAFHYLVEHAARTDRPATNMLSRV